VAKFADDPQIAGRQIKKSPGNFMERGCAALYRNTVGLIMGKYIAYALVVLIILFALEWFEIVDIPFLEIPDFTGNKEEMMEKTRDSLKRF
jgi:hypothetical protein